MLGNLPGVLEALLRDSLPVHLQGTPAPVKVSSLPQPFQIDRDTLDPVASEPAPQDQVDEFPFDPAAPGVLRILTKSPYPGPRRVSLVNGTGERLSLTPAEILWETVDPRRFTLNLRPGRVTAGFTGVRVLYGVTGFSSRIKAAREVHLVLESTNAGRLTEAESLVTAVILLNRKNLIDSSSAEYDDGDYGASVRTLDLQVLGGQRLSATQRVLVLKVELEFVAERVLRDDEGLPIRRIASPGVPPDPARPIDLRIDAEI